jgi:hypothetical protein
MSVGTTAVRAYSTRPDQRLVGAGGSWSAWKAICPFELTKWTKTLQSDPIGATDYTDDRNLKRLRGSGDSRSHLLAIIDYANTGREKQVRQRFDHLQIAGRCDKYEPAEELRRFINDHATPWEPEPKVRKPKSPPRRIRVCDACGFEFSTVDERYCLECRKGVRSHLNQVGYLQNVPRKTFIHPDNYNAWREERGDPSPWGENAVKDLEEK